MVHKPFASAPTPRPEKNSEPMRSAVRFPLELSIEVQTELGPVQALTRDVSSVGIQFEMSYAPRLGSPVEWKMHLPSETMGTREDVTVACVAAGVSGPRQMVTT